MDVNEKTKQILVLYYTNKHKHEWYINFSVAVETQYINDSTFTLVFCKFVIS